MSNLRKANLVCNHRNLRLFDAQRRITSHQRSGLFLRVWRTYGGRMYVAHSLGCGTRVRLALARARILLLYVRKYLMHSYIACILPYISVCTLMLLVYSRMLLVITRMLLVYTRMLLVCNRMLCVYTRMLLVCTRMLFLCTRVLLV